MSKRLESRRPAREEFRSTVVSEPGAIIHVERIEISERTRKALTTGVKSIGSPRDSGASR
jgi:hypothetical protein